MKAKFNKIVCVCPCFYVQVGKAVINEMH